MAAWPTSAHGTTGGARGGWDAESVRATQVSRWAAFVDAAAGPTPFALSNEAAAPTPGDIGTHNTIMTFGWVLGRAAYGHDRLSLLDWGGGIGHYAIYARALLPQVDLDYHCRELPLLTAAGRELLHGATFHDTDASALGRRYDLVLASSSLHYAEDWRAALAGLAGATGEYLFVTRQPFVRVAPSFVVIQRPHRHGYLTEYPGWFLNRDEFLAAASALGLEVVREVLVAEQPYVPNAPEQADYRGFLFRRRDAELAESAA